MCHLHVPRLRRTVSRVRLSGPPPCNPRGGERQSERPQLDTWRPWARWRCFPFKEPTGDAFGTPNREGTYAPPSPIQSKAGKLIDWFQPLTTLLAVHWLSTQPRKDWQPQTLTSTYKPHSFPAQVLVGLCEPLLCWSSERVLRVGAVHPRRAMGSTTGGPSTLMTLMDHLSVKETYIHAMYPRTSKVSFSPTG